MSIKKKVKFKKFNFHPITTFILLILGTFLLSWILSVFQFQATYTVVRPENLELESIFVTVKNLINYDGIKYIISNAATNFASFAPLISLLIALLGLSIAHASGLIDTFIKRVTLNISNKHLTFILILVAIFSSIINDVGYVILIPLAALLFLANGRSPLLGIVAAFSGVAFGYGATLFVGSMEVNLISLTTSSARLIDPEFHVSLTSNLFIMIVFSIILALVGTIVIENIVMKNLGKYKLSLEETQELDKNVFPIEEQKKIELEINEKKGLKSAYVVGSIIILLFIYMIVPNLPASGMLLDMEEKTYLRQLFGPNSYFQDGFTYMVSLFFAITGIAYGLGAKTLKNDKQLIEGASDYIKNTGSLVALLFFASQFIAIFKETNIGTVVTAIGANLIKELAFSGLPLVLLVIIVILVCNLFMTSPVTKWTILAPVVVPLMMQSNISPQFAQFILRAGDSITKGITPLLAYFVIYLGYLNIYNKSKKPITIRKAISYVMPSCVAMGLTWILLIVGWYLIGLPIGPGVFPTL